MGWGWVAAEGDRHRREAIDALTSQWEEAGALRSGLAAIDAADRLWLLTIVEGYFQATDSLGWSPDQYTEWLSDLAATEILRPAG